MYTERDYEDINIKIEATRSELNRNERSQDNFMTRFGKENLGLLEKHNMLCDEMSELIRIRHEIAKDIF